MDKLLFDAFPAEIRRKIGFCFREKSGEYYVFPAEGYRISKGSESGYLKARSFQSICNMTDLIVSVM